MLRAIAVALALTLPAAAQNADATKALERFTELRPGDDDLAMYRLDWAPDLAEAQKRAAKEKRPVLLVVIHAKYGDMVTGHC
ncbi:MAG: hypothetical protein FD180_2164 [Planctomycetota bacterium]|nr:MAG: hypothetical protein FD180_2164 [Planctomycetota bacterium]